MNKDNSKRAPFMNYFKYLAICFFVIIPIHGLFMWIELSDTICTDMSGYGVDLEGNIYVGKHSKIDVYDKDNLVKTIDLKDGNRNYFFEVNKNNLIVIQTHNETYEMDLDGNVLRTLGENIKGETYDIDTTKEFVSPDDTLYKVKYQYVTEKVVRYENGKEILVYQLPLEAYIFKIVRIIFNGIAFVLIVIIVRKAIIQMYGKFLISPKEWINEWRNIFKSERT